MQYFVFILLPKNEWQTKPSKKRKPQGTVPASATEKNSQEDGVIENHVNEEEDEKSSSKPTKPMRGGKKGQLSIYCFLK